MKRCKSKPRRRSSVYCISTQYALLNTEIRTVTSAIIRFTSYFTERAFITWLHQGRLEKKNLLSPAVFITSRFSTAYGERYNYLVYMPFSGTSLPEQPSYVCAYGSRMCSIHTFTVSYKTPHAPIEACISDWPKRLKTWLVYFVTKLLIVTYRWNYYQYVSKYNLKD